MTTNALKGSPQPNTMTGIAVGDDSRERIVSCADLGTLTA